MPQVKGLKELNVAGLATKDPGRKGGQASEQKDFPLFLPVCFRAASLRTRSSMTFP
jgi:hypothetical protein